MTENVKDVDISMTSRELVTLLKEQNIEFSADREAELKESKEGKFDAPFNNYSGGAYLFGRSSGVTESVVRYVYHANKLEYTKSVLSKYLLWETPDKFQSLRVFEFPCGDQKFRALVCNGGAAIEEMLKIFNAGKLKDVDVIETMLCPQGCINGGGQPKISKKTLIADRA